MPLWSAQLSAKFFYHGDTDGLMMEMSISAILTNDSNVYCLIKPAIH
ncbi:MAG: hypothetical protein KBG83_03805 [Bacteroidetes bacterium]|nr:hypothetical protein [Bacteroidota bacterium]